MQEDKNRQLWKVIDKDFVQALKIKAVAWTNIFTNTRRKVIKPAENHFIIRCDFNLFNEHKNRHSLKENFLLVFGYQ